MRCLINFVIVHVHVHMQDKCVVTVLKIILFQNHNYHLNGIYMTLFKYVETLSTNLGYFK